MILLIDNYDSFVFNLARYFSELGEETQVVRNDVCSVTDVIDQQPDAIVLSPGPCTPSEAGICVDLVRAASGAIPLLGVCLGHQSIAAAFHGNVVRAPEPVHGRTSPVFHDGNGIFRGVASPFRTTRYHSLIVSRESLPDELRVTAWTEDGLIMGLQHAEHPTFGVQFHPESVLTESGHQLLAKFLKIAGMQPRTVPTGDSLGSEAVGADIAEELQSAWSQRDDRNPPLHW